MKRPSRKKLSEEVEANQDIDAELEKHDIFAMSVALAINLIPILLGIFGFFGLIAWLIFG
ncbi:MAG TPA: hypothetical protein VFC79_13580 [Tissierellaceae bacterium]|nr:hypothetical protein [Clostridiales bacterium]HZK01043.1 hypothetical protein [Tissierellaceae bacterium]